MPYAKKGLRTNIPAKQDVVKRIMNGERQQAIARDLGITMERLRQILYKEIGRAGVQDAIRAHAHHPREAPRMSRPTGVCIVCLRPTERRKTCGKQCYSDYLYIYHRVDPERHAENRRRYARWVIENPEKSGPARVRYAQRLLAGEPLAKRCTFYMKGSKASEIWDRVQRARLSAAAGATAIDSIAEKA